MDERMKKIWKLKTLQQLRFVQWDRHVGDAYYGWIKREDLHEDFVILFFKDDRKIGYITSSPLHGKKIAKLLNIESTQIQPCKRIEDEFTIKNVIHLKPSR